MSGQPAAQPVPTAGRRRRWLSAIVTAVVAAFLLIAGTGVASADTLSTYVPQAGANVGDGCHIQWGAVFDPRAASNAAITHRFAVIGGATVSGCLHPHDIQVQVWEAFALPGQNWQYGQAAYTHFVNSYGFGGRILETPRYCDPYGRGWWWSTGVRIWLDGRAIGLTTNSTSGSNYSPSDYTSALGVASGSC